jgi:dTDP-4-amino-4,6-dideoxygalactose transaminase
MTKDINSLPFALPDIGSEEIEEVVDCLKSGWLTTGPKTLRFEKEFAEYIGAPYALAVNSATAGLHLALEAIGLSGGDQVITTPYTFTASAEVIRYLGADPIFVDIDPQTMNLDPWRVGERLSAVKPERRKNIKAILPVHFAGQSCDMEPILDIARHYDLKVVEDAAHCPPCTYRGKKVGTIGDVTVFSFYVTKPLATGEGGMVTTLSEELANRIKIMRLHGINKDIWDRYREGNKPNWYYEVVEPGFKYNMPDLMAAIGIHQLRKIDRLQIRREEIAGRYTEAFADLPLRLPRIAQPDDTHSWHLYMIQLELAALTIGRNQVIEELAELGIGTSVHFIPLHIQPYWRDRYGLKPDDFTVAMDCYSRAISLPIYSKMTNAEVDRVIEGVRRVVIKGKR